MHRFFVLGSPGESGSTTITGDDARHATKVLRLREGDRFIAVVAGKGQYIARITSAGPHEVQALIEASLERDVEPATLVWLFQGMPKGDKMEMIIQRCTEIGVAAIVPVESSRVVARPDGKRVLSRIQRWRKIALEAAELAGRTHVPEIMEPVSFEESLRMAAGFDVRLMPWEEESARAIGPVLRERGPGRVSLLIGPEGGFSEDEARDALNAGVLPVTLGPRMMRTENAGAVALSIILYEYGDMGR